MKPKAVTSYEDSDFRKAVEQARKTYQEVLEKEIRTVNIGTRRRFGRNSSG